MKVFGSSHCRHCDAVTASCTPILSLPDNCCVGGGVGCQVFPLQNKEPFVTIANDIADRLQMQFKVEVDSSGSIGKLRFGWHSSDQLCPWKVSGGSFSRSLRWCRTGKRYRRQDEIGTPFCITVDHDSAKDQTVTVRCRDSMRQVRLPIQSVVDSGLTKASLGLTPAAPALS